jgi:isocitrate dehydrogenase
MGRQFDPVKLPQRREEVSAVHVGSRLVTGVDVYVESTLQPNDLGEELKMVTAGSSLTLQKITNRGNTVFPGESSAVSLIDHYRCRFLARSRSSDVGDPEILSLLTRIGEITVGCT